MTDKPYAWPESSGVFNAPKTFVMTTAPESVPRRTADTVLVMTPLDLISHLEDPGAGVVTVVLTGRFASDPDLATFLRDNYPRIEIVVEQPVAAFFDLSETMVA